MRNQLTFPLKIARRPGPLGPERQAAHERRELFLGVARHRDGRRPSACSEGLRGRVAVAAARIVAVKGDILARRNGIGSDRAGRIRAIEDPPPAAVIPHDPSVADLAGPAGFADGVPNVIPIPDLVSNPKALGFAVARPGAGSRVRKLGNVRFSEAVTETASFAHQLAHPIQGSAARSKGAEHFFHRLHVRFIRGTRRGSSEINRSRRDGCGSEEGCESKEGSLKLHGLAVIARTPLKLPLCQAAGAPIITVSARRLISLPFRKLNTFPSNYCACFGRIGDRRLKESQVAKFTLEF